jgi:hypothetical protein
LYSSARSVGEVFESVVNSTLFQAPISIWLYITRPFIDMFDADLSATGFFFLMLCGIWELFVWGIIGGAITRIAALKFTRDEAPSIVAALKHSVTKVFSYGLPPFIALAGTAVFALQLVVLGLLMRLEIFAFLAALFWPFAIVLGLMMAVLLLGALFGWPLMWATVSVEGTDAFDALSRSYAYTYHRPLRLLWYVIFAGFLAVVSMFVVKLFATSAVLLGNWSVEWGVDDTTMATVVNPRPQSPAAAADVVTPPVKAVPAEGGDAAKKADETDTAAPPKEPSKMLNAAAAVIRFWKKVVALLVAGFQAGFLWVSAVGIYLLLRRDIDGVQMNEVFVDESDEYGMPPLLDDPATGVPEVGPGSAVPGDNRG